MFETLSAIRPFVQYKSSASPFKSTSSEELAIQARPAADRQQAGLNKNNNHHNYKDNNMELGALETKQRFPARLLAEPGKRASRQQRSQPIFNSWAAQYGEFAANQPAGLSVRARREQFELQFD